MANIKINDRSFEIDKIVSFGCSFTAGDELLAHIIHPDADKIKKEKGILYWKEHFENKSKPVSSEEQKIAWAGQVASRLNVEFDSRARGGYSLSHSLYLLENMIYQEQFSDNTLILFGITTMGRSMYFYDNTAMIKNFLFAHPQWWPKKDWDEKTVLDIFNDSMQVWLQMTYLHRLTQIAESLNGRLRIFCMSGLVPKPILDTEVSKHPILHNKYMEILNSPYVFSKVSLMGLCQDPKKDQHSGNHPKLHIHEKFADYVMSTLQ